jgi:MFS family permease
LVAFGGMLLFGGRLADLRGRRQMFLVGTALFLVSSLLCGLAWAAPVLIVARVVQGVSAAFMAPAALATLMVLFSSGASRTKALGFWSASGGLGATAALLIGGAVTGTLGWQWVFYLNLPVAAVLLALAPMLLPESRDEARAYDPVGAVAVTVGLMLLVGAIGQAPAWGWTSWPVLAMFAGALAFIALFVVIESRSAAPLVPLRIFRSRLFVGGNLSLVLIAVAAWGEGTTVSAYAQDVLRYSPLVFGLASAAMTVMTLVGAYAAQHFASRFGDRVVIVGGFVAMGIGAYLLSYSPADGNYVRDLLPGLLVFGLGLGSAPVSATSAGLSVDHRLVGVASGASNAAFQIGGAIGTALASSVTVSVGGSTRAYAAGFLTCVLVTVAGVVLALVLLKAGPRRELDVLAVDTP